jgi:ABC-2 type transport system permease protein
MASLFVLPVYLATRQEEKRLIQVIDETGWFSGKFENTGNFTFVPVALRLEDAKSRLTRSKGDALLYIPATRLNVPAKAIIYSDNPPSINLKGYISNVMNREIEKQKLAAEIRKEILQLSPGLESTADTTREDLMSETILKNIRSEVQLTTIKISEGGSEQKSFTEAYMIAGLVFSILIYMFIFMFGAQVMRGVIEEKTNRIVEVIVSSVKPFQLMMGKIIGVAMVGLTQFVLWILFTGIIITVVQQSFPDKFKLKEPTSMIQVNQEMNPAAGLSIENEKNISDAEATNVVLEALASINFPLLLSAFIFFFIGGYLLYGALFAAIGAAVDNETDTQQFMLPITVPLIFAMVVAQSIVNDPNGPLALWLSMIPFTSPVIMMVRIPFGVPVWQVGTSMALLVAGFILTTWVAARIYRTGILMYGKKVNYRELWKWMRYKG